MYLPLIIGAVSNCGLNPLFHLTSMSFLPDLPVVGQNSTLKLSMTVPEVITSGTATYLTTLNFIPFTPTVDPLCGTVACPIEVGTLDTVSSFPVPSGVSGSLSIKINWESESRELLCVLLKMKL